MLITLIRRKYLQNKKKYLSFDSLFKDELENAYLFGYEALRFLKIMLAVTFSLILFLAIWSNRSRYLWHYKKKKKRF